MPSAFQRLHASALQLLLQLLLFSYHTLPYSGESETHGNETNKRVFGGLLVSALWRVRQSRAASNAGNGRKQTLWYPVRSAWCVVASVMRWTADRHHDYDKEWFPPLSDKILND